MKKALFLLIAATALFFACSKENTPTNVVKAYMDCIIAKEFEKSLNYIDLEGVTDKEKEQYIKFFKSMAESESTDFIKSYQIVGEPEIKQDDKGNETAKVKLNTITKKEKDAKQSSYDLKKVNGIWKITM